jgi:ferritin-like metal-binding protein YciE
METPKEKKKQPTTKCGSWIKRFICSWLQDIYYAEKTLSKTLPNMAKNASTPQLATSN